MKFTNGFWKIREEITPLYAVEYGGCRINGGELTIYAPGKQIRSRGDILNLGMLTIRITSPMEDVLKISVSHFEGAADPGPFTVIEECDPRVSIIESEENIIFQTGSTKAVVDKRPDSWGIRFLDEDRELTSTGLKNMAYMKNRDNGKCYMVEQLALDVGEYVYGMGERFTPFVKNGQIVEMWNEDGGTASEIAYKNIPFYLTNKGYGVLVSNPGDVSYEVASEKVERIQFSLEGERLDYYVINGGTPKGTIKKYTDLTGKPSLPPAWSFGLWLTTSFTTDYDEDTTSGFIDGMAKRDIPLQVFHFDCFWMEAYEWCNFTWDSKTFPDPVGMLKRYHEKGLKICVWINPYIAQKSPLFQEGMENGYFIKKRNGSVWQTDMWQAGMGVVDFTNPEAAAWYQQKLKTLLDMGVDCFKTDFGERIPVKDIVYHDGSDPVGMHNYYTYLYNKAVFELLVKERGEGEAVLFARSAAAGSQKFPVHWGGDCSASYPSMAETLRSGLSLACSGFGFWSHDIGGFESTATADVYKRWCQFGLLSSHSRLHGSSSYRVPWLFDEEACDVLRKFVKLKCRLMPYLYRQAVAAHENGIPVMRPMFMEFPEDRACEVLDRQYMLGDSLLVAPVFKESGDVEYYLPDGKWVNLLSEKVMEGGSWKKETFDYFGLPVLVRENSIITVGSCDSRTDYEYGDGVEFWLSVFEDGGIGETSVTDLRGKVVINVKAVREADVIRLFVTGGNGNWSYKVLGAQNVKVLTI
ncbi:alpha-D-xyloside xylohydrolase [Lacrimispora xylanisolvens]|uniref:alpha-D-xyloside xylohydrolase n=1 Tax=Lacrimispora xylanisolvens TaxID=384636 RepID=A0A2S6HYL4_9FIRM|nr:alpha-xylosidase [Hungatella xylanolytica]PPK83148.1 alpha-D-xyloside xylohydrolase [Hungatella xylanolytica]